MISISLKENLKVSDSFVGRDLLSFTGKTRNQWSFKGKIHVTGIHLIREMI